MDEINKRRTRQLLAEHYGIDADDLQGLIQHAAESQLHAEEVFYAVVNRLCDLVGGASQTNGKAVAAAAVAGNPDATLLVALGMNADVDDELAESIAHAVAHGLAEKLIGDRVDAILAAETAAEGSTVDPGAS